MSVSQDVSVLSALGELFFAGGHGWAVHRLAPARSERHVPGQRNLKRHIERLCSADAGFAVLAMSVAVAVPEGTRGAGGDGDGEPWGRAAIIAGTEWARYGAEDTVPLSWLAERLRQCRASRRLIAVEFTTAGGRELDAAMILAALAPREEAGSMAGGASMIAVRQAGSRPGLLSTLVEGLRGEAMDPATGAITLRSLGDYIAAALPEAAVARCDDRAPLLVPPPLFARWGPTGGDGLDDGGYGGDGVTSDGDSGHSEEGEGEAGAEAGIVLPGRIRLLNTIAEGGFGVVYAAEQVAIGRPVAVKLLRDEIDIHSEDGQLFLGEIRAIGKLDHRNIVRIYHADVIPSSDGRVFFAMELLRGQNLAELIERHGPLPIERTLALIGQVLDGLGAAHSAGIIHADLKPDNIMITPDGDSERAVILDFGLARIHRAGESQRSRGGTPLYMSPEQYWHGRVDIRSDLFTAALIFYEMLTGWQRQSEADMCPPLALQGPLTPRLYEALCRALARAPEDRFSSAAELRRALCDDEPAPAAPASAPPPFHGLRSFDEEDHGRLFGRDEVLAELSTQALYQHAVVVTAHSGVGKTSLLRAGLVPKLRAAHHRPVYVALRGELDDELRAVLWPESATGLEAVRAYLAHHAKDKVVLILDQLETVLSVAPEVVKERVAVLQGILALACSGEREVTIVLSIREDFFARLFEVCQPVCGHLAVVRVHPLDGSGARAAIARPLAERRVVVEDALMDRLVADLIHAGAEIGVQMGWSNAEAVYPPHLQLACSVLYDALEPDTATLRLSHYQQIGGLSAIVGEHLDRVLDEELDDALVPAARGIFAALVTSAQTRYARATSEIVALLAPSYPAEVIAEVLGRLHKARLLVPVALGPGGHGWELIHDSLVPRIQSWLERSDLARRQAKEVLRFHLRRASAQAPSLLSARELRDVLAHEGVIAEVDRERGTVEGDPEPHRLTAARLVSLSRRKIRQRRGALASVAVAIGLGALVSAGLWFRERELRIGNIGRFVLMMSAFDWDADKRQAKAVPMSELPGLTWQLYAPDAKDPQSPGLPLAMYRNQRVQTSEARASTAVGAVGTTLEVEVEASGGPAFLLVSGRGRKGESCPPSWIRIAWLPGYIDRGTLSRLHVVVPTCQATMAGMTEIPEGAFYARDAGVAGEVDKSHAYRQVPAQGFWIDTTEVSNAAYQVYADMTKTTGRSMPLYFKQDQELAKPDRPVAFIDWYEARDYCRFMGKSLPDAEQWTKAARGGIYLDAAHRVRNPEPQREVPWPHYTPGAEIPANVANFFDTKDSYEVSAPVDSMPEGASPYGVLHMSGNVQEWTITDSPEDPDFVMVRGGGWGMPAVDGDHHIYRIDYPNERAKRFVKYDTGVRCVLASTTSTQDSAETLLVNAKHQAVK